ncbi:MAG: amino acid ABC transporter substrate-binding protein [Geminicoccales bacterium]
MMRLASTLVAGSAAALAVSLGTAQAGETFDAVKEKGFVQCGVNTGLPGFAAPDDAGTWLGFDVDLCRAVAAAVFGDIEAVKFTPLNATERFTALQSGEVDVLARNTTWTLSRDAALGLEFTGVNYYDGQGFMVPKDLGVQSALELDGAAVCVQTGTTTELNLADYFRANQIEYTPVVFEGNDEAVAAYEAGRCDTFTTDKSGLYASRTKLAEPEAHIVLPETISKEPLGPSVRQGDPAWGDVVRWALYAMVRAEELGVSSSNVDEMRDTSTDPKIRRLLGVEDEMGKDLGLPADWGYQIVKQVGNYGESFQENLGQPPLSIERGLNALWTDGGLQYAMPVR